MNRKDTILKFLDDDRFPPVNTDDIIIMLEIPQEDKSELEKILFELTENGDIVLTSKKKYATPRKLGYASGKFSANERGFGFVIHDDGDIFIPPDKTDSAMNGDTVLVQVSSSSKSSMHREGKILRILKRGSSTIVGTYHASRNFGFVIPDEKKTGFDIFIPKAHASNAKNGQKVVAKIIKWPQNGRKPEGEIVEILGYPGDKGVDLASIVKRYNLHDEFDEKVLKQCDKIGESLTDADIKFREDFRSHSIITIDGSDSRDFDDAVCVTKSGNIYTLEVHIADVAHYVTENSPLDREAFIRGTSVYFPGMVVPMLPKKLSNGICSLNPNEDRLTLSVIMDINNKGEILEHRILEGVICSKERMTYDDVTSIIEGDKKLKKKYNHIYEEIMLMSELAKILRERRMSAGSIDFDFPETKIVVDKNGKAIDVFKYESGISNKIIEEFMLAANKTIAEEFFWADIPFIYRVHEKPSNEKIAAFNEFAKNFGCRLGKNHEPHPGEFAALLKKFKGTKEEMLFSKLMLRSLMKAKYSENCEGHFGLAFKYYCHFTSPIRRYPDLVIHRIIKEFINYGVSEKRYSFLKRLASEAAKRSSETELIAMDAERDADDMKKAEYMQKHIGESFEAIISSVTNFGFFAELENGIEGLVRLSDLKDDYYIFNEKDLSLIGERTHNTYRIGDSVKIIVAASNPMTRQIDFYPGGHYNGD